MSEEQKGVEQVAAEQSAAIEPAGKPPKKVKNFKPRVCKTCGESFTSTNAPNRQNCYECIPDQAASNRAADVKHRAKKKERSDAASYRYNSASVPSKAEAKEILRERGLQHPHVIDTVYTALTRFAAANQIPANRFLFLNGATQTKLTHEAKKAQPLGDIPAEPVIGELLTKAELFALYDACFSPYEPESFEDFLAIRFKCKSDVYYLGEDIFKNDFAAVHESWRDFFPRFDPTTLPPNYTQRQAINWLASQSEIKDFLLLASRRAFKSSFMRLWLCTAIITLPDIRVLIVSQERGLSKDNIEALRGYFEVIPGFETRFQRLFPEFVISVGDGSVMSLEVPMRRLKLPQSVESSSAMSATAGRRADIILWDDVVSEETVGNDEQIQKSIHKRDMTAKLIEKGGLKITLATPYATNDLYAVMIERAERNQDSTFAYKIDPAFKVKEEARHKLTPELLPTLTLDDIESFLFPEGLPWKELRVDMLNNPTAFLSQNLCIFPPDNTRNEVLNFDEASLRRALINPDRVPAGRTVMVCDLAYSIKATADLSSLCVVRVSDSPNGEMQKVLTVLDVVAARLRLPDFCQRLVQLCAKYNPEIVVIERSSAADLIAAEINRRAQYHGTVVPLRWHPVDISKNAKFERLKALTTLLEEVGDGTRRLQFKLGPYVDDFFAQLIRLDGSTAKQVKTRRNDLADSLALAQRIFAPVVLGGGENKDSKEAQDALDELLRQQRKIDHYNTMFGPMGGTVKHPAPPTTHAPTVSQWLRGQQPEPESEPQPARAVDPRDKVFHYTKSIGSGDKNTLFGARGLFARRTK